MRIKSYFSGTVEAAMALARQELGDDALLLSSKPAAAEARHLGTYEVVFGTEDSTSAASPSAVLPEPCGALAAYLTAQDFSPKLAREIESSIPYPEATDGDVREAITAKIHTAALSPDTRAVVFVGPPGSGKTTTLIKLAVLQALNPERPIRILSLDSRRIGAQNQLRTLAAIAGLPFEATVSPDAAIGHMHADGGRSLFLIDTPGFAPAEMAAARSWVEAIEKIPHREVHLVVTATARAADLTLTAERYRMFAPERLIFTRYDEASTAGGVASLSAQTGWPISWLGTGQSIPEDIEAATGVRIASSVLANEADERTLTAAAGRVS